MTVAAPYFDGAFPSRAIHALGTALARRPLSTEPRDLVDSHHLVSYCAEVAHEAGYRSEQVYFYADELDTLLSGSAPFVFISLPGRQRAFAVVQADKRTVTFADDNGAIKVVGRSEAQKALTLEFEGRTSQLARGIAGKSVMNSRLVDALSSELRQTRALGWGFVFRPNVAESVGETTRSLRLGKTVGTLLTLSLAQSALTTVGWALIGSLALTGRAERGNIFGWALVSLTATFLQLLATRAVGRFTIRAATALRERLLEGALALPPEDVGTYGIGGLTVVASQSDAFLNLGLTFFIALLTMLTNAAATVAVLSAAPLAGLTVGVFAGFALTLLLMAPKIAGLAREHQSVRTRLTTDMVERMLGHRTRLVQQMPVQWHDGEDEAIAGYAVLSRNVDRWNAAVRILPRGYYLISVATLFLVLVGHPTQEAMALSIGGMTLGAASLFAIAEVVISGGGVYALWHAIRPLIRDVPTPEPIRDADLDVGADVDGAKPTPLVELRNVSFAYGPHAKRVLDEVSLSIHRADRILVEGKSGSGKSTLANLITGLRRPDGGVVLVRGLDQRSLGPRGVRRTVAAAPQFYKNHIFSQSLAFNLLMGRAWPASDGDLREANIVARELGLGPLLDRMPAGLHQRIGETGWQLSHGEKSRVYLARSLLQPSELIILDETFGALDPDTLRQCMDVVLARARATVVITHR